MYDVLRRLLETLVSFKPLWVSQEHRELFGSRVFPSECGWAHGLWSSLREKKTESKRVVQEHFIYSSASLTETAWAGRSSLVYGSRGVSPSWGKHDRAAKFTSCVAGWEAEEKMSALSSVSPFQVLSTWAPSSQMVSALQLMGSGMLSRAPLILGDPKPN